MAISGADGSIILTTKVDQSGLNKGMTSMQKGVRSLSSSFKALGTTIAAVFSITAIVNFSKQAGEFATQTEASVQRLVDIYGEAAQSVGDFIDANARAIGMSKASASSFASVYGNLFSVWADQNTNAELTNRYLNMTAVVASKTGRTVQDVQERVRSGLLGNTEAIEDLGVFVNVKTIEMTDAFQRMADGRSWEQLGAYEQQQIRSMAILEQATAKYGNTVADTTATTRAQYQAAYEDFQNTWGQVVNTVLIPVLKVLTQVFTIATKGLQVMSGLSGKTVENSGQTSSNIKQQTKEQEKLNKAVKKGLAGFDEINTLTEQSAENTADAGTGTQVSGIGDLGGSLSGSSYVEEADSTLMAIMGIVAGALVAVGLILLFTGHIGWGIGFIIAGAGLLAVTMASASSFGYDGIINMLTTIMGIAGGALLALGIILLWIGGVVGKPVAIGMIIAGAALIVGAVAAKAAFAPEDVQGWLSLIMGIAGGALLALGIVLVMVGSVPLGVGLIIAGAVSLVSAFAINSNTIVELLQGPIGIIVMLVSTLTLVIGIILACTGVALSLALGLIAVGAVGLASTVALNWNTLPEKITKFFQDNAGLIVGISLAILVLGIILCCCGIITPLSVGMIVFGAAGIVATVALNWSAITTAISDFFKNNAGLVVGISLALLVLGILLLVTGVGIPLAIGLVVAGVAGLVTEAILNWNYISQTITNFFQQNAGLIVGVSLALLVLGIILLFTGVGVPLAIGLIVAGGGLLATTAILNWNFIVDKVKEVWNAVKQFWNTYIAPIFTLAWWTNLAKVCGNGLIAGFEAAVNGIIWLFEGMISFVVSGLNLFLQGVDAVISAVGNVFGADWGVATIPDVKLGRVSIPRLAQGAVIPPNREFLAVLGDQKHGTNIEAPLDTIVQAFNMALSNNSSSTQDNRPIVLQVDGREIARATRSGENRLGSQIVYGGFANAY